MANIFTEAANKEYKAYKNLDILVKGIKKNNLTKNPEVIAWLDQIVEDEKELKTLVDSAKTKEVSVFAQEYEAFRSKTKREMTDKQKEALNHFFTHMDSSVVKYREWKNLYKVYLKSTLKENVKLNEWRRETAQLNDRYNKARRGLSPEEIRTLKFQRNDPRGFSKQLANIEDKFKQSNVLGQLESVQTELTNMLDGYNNYSVKDSNASVPEKLQDIADQIKEKYEKLNNFKETELDNATKALKEAEANLMEMRNLRQNKENLDSLTYIPDDIDFHECLQAYNRAVKNLNEWWKERFNEEDFLSFNTFLLEDEEKIDTMFKVEDLTKKVQERIENYKLQHDEIISKVELAKQHQKQKEELEQQYNKYTEDKKIIGEKIQLIDTIQKDLDALKQEYKNCNAKVNPNMVHETLIDNVKQLYNTKERNKGFHSNSKEYKAMELAMKIVAEWNKPEAKAWRESHVNKGIPQTLKEAEKLLVNKTQAYLDAKRQQTRLNPSLRRQTRMAFADALLEVATGAKNDVDILTPKQAQVNAKTKVNKTEKAQVKEEPEKAQVKKEPEKIL